MDGVHLVLLALQWHAAAQLGGAGGKHHFFLSEEHSDILRRYSSLHIIKVMGTYTVKKTNYSTSEMTEEFIGIFLQLSIFLFFAHG